MKTFAARARFILLAALLAPGQLFPSFAAAVDLSYAEASANSSVPAVPFRHPGLLNNLEELNFIKDKIRARAAPWNGALSKIESSSYGSLNWTPKPRRVVDVGFYNNPDNGASDELKDSTAAYVHTLIWVFTGKEEHAKKAAEILNAWSAVLQNHTGDNAKLQAAWAGSVFPLSAEILRATYPKWTSQASADFAAMLQRAFVPLIVNGMPVYNGNWELAMGNALMAIGVFADDRASFDRGVFLWRKRVPAYFYMSSDGPVPISPYNVIIGINSYWGNPGRFVDGLCQETARDLGHVQLGLAATFNAAEIAYHQGLNLYSEESARVAAAMEFHSNYLLGNPVPPWLCGGKLNVGGIKATWEIGYNHFHNRLGMDLPLTNRLITGKVRQSREIGISEMGIFYAVGTDTLTHAELGGIGSPEEPHVRPAIISKAPAITSPARYSVNLPVEASLR